MLFVKSSVYGVNTAIFRGSIARTFVSTAWRTVTAGAPAPFRILSPISRSWANVPSAPAEVQPNIDDIRGRGANEFGGLWQFVVQHPQFFLPSYFLQENARCADDSSSSNLLMKIQLHHRIGGRHDQANAQRSILLERLTQAASCCSIVRVWRRAG